MRTLLALLSSCFLLALVAAGCGGGDNNKSSGGGGGGGAKPKATQTTAGGGGAKGKSVTVTMKDIQFHPATVTIAKGGTVKWVNDEAVGHDVTSQGGPGSFKSGAAGGLSQGSTFSHTFTKAGTYKYVCTVHAPGMAGTVVVK